MELHPRLARAPELYGDYWLKSDPISISALRGYVILLHFWDYCLAGSMRTLPYLNEWHRKYQDYGLVVIGVHTPGFKFGKKPENVTRAAEHSRIQHPVVMDNEAIIWNAFGNRLKPARCLIDKDGFVRFAYEGEGGYEEFERAIQVLLMDAGTRGEMPLLMEPLRESDRQGVVHFRQSADVAFGYLRGTIGNPEGFSPESTVDHADPGLHLPGRFYAQGVWTDDRECIRFKGKEPGYLLAYYEGLDVEGVLSSEDGKVCEVVVEQDGEMLTEKNKGDDVTINGRGTSILPVKDPRLYNIVKNTEFGGHTLKLHASQSGIEAYSLSFSTGVIPELISNN